MTSNGKRATTVKDSAYQAAKAATESGDSLSQKKKFGEARQAYVKALGIYVKLAEKGSLDDYLEELAPLCYKLADTCGMEGNLEDAVDLFILARESYGRLAEEDPMYLINLVYVHGQLGVTYHCMARYDDAEEEYFLAREFCTELKSDDTVSYIANSADICRCLSELYCDMGRCSDAEAEYLREIEFGKQLVELAPQVILPVLAEAYSHIAQFYQTQGRVKDAAMMTAKAQEILNEVSVLDTEDLGGVNS